MYVLELLLSTVMASLEDGLFPDTSNIRPHCLWSSFTVTAVIQGHHTVTFLQFILFLSLNSLCDSVETLFLTRCSKMTME